MWTGAVSWRLHRRLLLGRKVETGGEEDEGGDPGECDGGGWVEEAVVADFHEAFRQDMLEESADELEGGQGHGSPSITVGLFVAEEYGMVFNLQDSAVGDGYPEDIGGKVLN